MQQSILRNLVLGGGAVALLLGAAPAQAATGGWHDASMPIGVASSPAASAHVTAGQGRGGNYAGLVASHARTAGVPVDLAHAIVRVESNFNPSARGRAGEVGLMQIKPRTARGIGFSGSTRALYNPDTNLRYGMRYLATAYKLAGGSVCGTVLRYNAGHYARRMNPVSRRYCSKVQAILGRGGAMATARAATPATPAVTVAEAGADGAALLRRRHDPAYI